MVIPVDIPFDGFRRESMCNDPHYYSNSQNYFNVNPALFEDQTNKPYELKPAEGFSDHEGLFLKAKFDENITGGFGISVGFTGANLLQNELKSSNLKPTIPRNPDRRAARRRVRARLDSSNGDMCEVHDQFYRDHKLLLLLFRVMAVMPVTRSSPGMITFKWRSWATYYAVFFYLLVTVIVVIVGYQRFKILHETEKFDDLIYAVIFIIFLVPHFWIPFVGWGVAPQVAVYKTGWGKFQLRYYKITGESLQFPHLKTQIVIICAGCLIVAVIFLLTLSALMDGFYLWHTSAYYHIITMLNMNSALWYINCKAIRIASRSLSDCFRKEVEDSMVSCMVSNYKYLWLNLSELLQALGNAYSRTYSTYCLFMLLIITVSVYGALSEIVVHGLTFSFKEIGLFVATVYCSTLLYIFCDCSYKTTFDVTQGIQDTLLSINTMSIDQQTQRQVDHFIQAIEMNPAIVSLKGYANVNRELLSSSVTTIAIYLIVLMQFKMSVQQNSMY